MTVEVKGIQKTFWVVTFPQSTSEALDVTWETDFEHFGLWARGGSSTFMKEIAGIYGSKSDAIRKAKQLLEAQGRTWEEAGGMRMSAESNVAKRVALMHMAGNREEYTKYFKKKLEKWDVGSPSEIADDKKDEFFEEVDRDWTADDEEDGKKASTLTAADDGGYASLRFERHGVSFNILPPGADISAGGVRTGTQPYGNKPIKAIRYVLDLVEKYGIKDVEVMS